MYQSLYLFGALFLAACRLAAQAPDATAHDRQELIKLFNALDGEHWKTSYKWDTTAPVSMWPGVALDGDSNVIALDLDGKLGDGASNVDGGCGSNPDVGLSGVLPDLALPNLLVLSLSFNQITGALPDFAEMPNLTTLALICNQLSGPIPVLNLPQLQYLYLAHNHFTGPFPNLGNLPVLTELNLVRNELEGNMPATLPAQLRNLAITYNHLSGLLPPLIPPNYDYYLKYNRFTFGDLLPIVSHLSNTAYIQYAPQDFIGIDTALTLSVGFPYTYNLGVDDGVIGNTYTWYKDGVQRFTTSNNQLYFSEVEAGDAGIWWCTVTNLTVTKATPDEHHLVLQSRPIHISICYPIVTYRDIVLSPGEVWVVNDSVYDCHKTGGYQQFPRKPGTDCDSFLVLQIHYEDRQYALPDTWAISPDEPFTASVTDNDEFDAAVDALQLLTPPSGSLTFNSDGSFDFIPLTHFLGLDSFRYALCPAGCPAPYCDNVTAVIHVVPDQTPAVITPNNDGVNDEFVLKDLEGDLDRYPHSSLLIVDAWGTLVFRQEGYRNDWRGDNRQGQPLPQATYFFTFRREENALPIHGRVAILRD